MIQLLDAAGFGRGRVDPTALDIRQGMLDLCSYIAKPDAALEPAAQEILNSLGELFNTSAQVVLDPFAGSGAVPIEAQRLGFTSLANDYNPVASMNLRLLMERAPNLATTDFGRLKEDLTLIAGAWQDAVRPYYPAHPRYGQPLGYIRCRRVSCEGPGCGAVVPASSKFLLDHRGGVGLRWKPINDASRELCLEVGRGQPSEFPHATIRSGSLTCPRCGFTTPRPAVMRQLVASRLEPTIVAVVYSHNGENVIESLALDQREALERSEVEVESRMSSS